MVFKGDGGEVEIKPNANTRCLLLRGEAQEELSWPRTLQDRPAPLAELAVESLKLLWRGDSHDDYGELAIVETAACALYLLERANTVENARELARQWWVGRQKKRF